MPALSVDTIFDAAIQIQLREEKALSFHVSPGQLSVKFPTTRRLAEYLSVPHYYVLPYFAMMEQELLVTRAERVGIMTTSRGTEMLFSMINDRYLSEVVEILGKELFEQLLQRVQGKHS